MNNKIKNNNYKTKVKKEFWKSTKFNHKKMKNNKLFGKDFYWIPEINSSISNLQLIKNTKKLTFINKKTKIHLKII
jgi:hypothetical protein